MVPVINFHITLPVRGWFYFPSVDESKIISVDNYLFKFPFKMKFVARYTDSFSSYGELDGLIFSLLLGISPDLRDRLIYFPEATILTELTFQTLISLEQFILDQPERAFPELNKSEGEFYE